MIKKTNLWTALITPLKDDGSIHFEDLKNLCIRQSQAGLGLVILGSTGEGLSFDEEEKKSIIKYVCDLNLTTPVMVGVSGFNIEKTKQWLEYCEQLQGLDSYLMPMPMYTKPDVMGQIAWFETLLNSVSKPCMLYNVPSRTGKNIDISTILALKNHSNFWALKEASGNLDKFANYVEAAGNEVEIFSGEDGLFPHLCYLGAKGLVSVMSNVWPAPTQVYVDQCLKLDFNNLYETWESASSSMFIASNPIPAKVFCHELDLISTRKLRLPLSAEDLNDLTRIKIAHKKVLNWYENRKENK
jgi:4-hydroxy-tetrahydrodipicolinate synthase